MSVAALKSFNEESIVSFIQNNYDNATGEPQGTAQINHFNPVERMAALYKRMPEMEREKIKYREALLKNKDA